MAKYIKEISKDKKSRNFTFELNGVHNSVGNALRRTMLSNIPILGLTDFSFTGNTELAPLLYNNDTLAHMISSIPVIAIPKDMSSDYTCKALLSKKLSTDELSVLLTSNDIVVEDSNVQLMKDLPLFVLRSGEEIVCEITLKIGKARDNALKYDAIVTPVYRLLKNSGNSDDSVYFSVTSVSHYEPDKVVSIAFDIIKQKLIDIKNYVDVTIIPLEEPINDTSLINIEIKNADHTYGQLIKCHIINMGVEFCGYDKVHPLDEIIIIKIRGSEPEKIFKKAIDELIQLF